MYGCIPLNVSMPTDNENKSSYIDIFDELYKDRKIYLNEEITGNVATKTVARLLSLAIADPTKDIDIYIDTYSTDLSAVMAIINTMEILPCKVNTFAVSHAYGFAFLILACGAKGRRRAFPHAQIYILQTRNKLVGKKSEIVVDYYKFVKNKEKFYSVMSKLTGKTMEEITAMMLPGVSYMNAQEAQKFGIIDKICK